MKMKPMTPKDFNDVVDSNSKDTRKPRKIKNATIGKGLVFSMIILLLLFGPNVALVCSGIYLACTALVLKDKPMKTRIAYGVAAFALIGFGCPLWVLETLSFVGFVGLALLAMKSPVVQPKTKK